MKRLTTIAVLIMIASLIIAADMVPTPVPMAAKNNEKTVKIAAKTAVKIQDNAYVSDLGQGDGNRG